MRGFFYEKKMMKSTTDSNSTQEVEVSLYQASGKIYAKSVKGIFNRWRWIFVALTQLIYYGLPWLNWNDRQAVLFDLGARRFYIFDLVLYPQDFIYLTGLLIISAYALFLFTAIAGRLWCGYACPQTVYTEIFMWIERKVEGDRGQRIRLDKNRWQLNSLARKSLKHVLWVMVALWTGFTFIGYFAPIQTLATDVLSVSLGPWQTFWILFYSFATWGNAGFMREQVCKYMCPYARFQSAMFDKDTMIVTYDAERGEPRGVRTAKNQEVKLGDCVDCGQCVQVCPTGIDIRKGLQYECIGCAACIDACDEVMTKLHLPKGLVKYSTENAMQYRWNFSQTIRRAFRARVLIYFSILIGIFALLMISLSLRVPFRVDVIRDRGVMARIVEQGRIENVYRLQLMNASEQVQHIRLSVKGIEGIQLITPSNYDVMPAEVRSVVARVQVPYQAATPGQHAIVFVVEMQGKSPIVIEEKSKLMVPSL